MYSPKLRAFWGSEPSFPLTKNVAITDANTPIAAIAIGNMIFSIPKSSPPATNEATAKVTTDTKAPT